MSDKKKKRAKEIATIGATGLVLGASILMTKNNEVLADEVNTDNLKQSDNEILEMEEQDLNTIVPSEAKIIDEVEFKDYGQKNKINPIEIVGNNDFDDNMRQFVHGGLDLKETKWSNYPSVVKIRIMNKEGNKWISAGSGVFVGSKSILSAGHVFRNNDGTWKIKPGDKIYYTFDSSSENDGWDIPTTGVEYSVTVPENINEILPDLTTNEKGETEYSAVIKDIAMLKVPTPIQLLYKGADFAEIGGMETLKVGDTTSIVGYPAPDSREKKERILKQPIRGVLYESSGKVKGITDGNRKLYPTDVPGGVARWIDSWTTKSHQWSHLYLNQDTSGGSSGAGVFNSEGKVIGVLTGSVGEYGQFDWNMATMLNKNLIKNIEKFSDKTIGWYEYKGNRYFFDENQRLVKNQKKLINGNYYLFDENGLMIKDLGKPAEANLYVNYLDTEGNTIKPTSKLLSNVIEGTEYNFKPIEIPGYEYVGTSKESEPLSGKVKMGNFGIRLIYKQIKRNIKIIAQDTNGKTLNVSEIDNLGWTNIPEGQHYNIDPEKINVTDNDGEEYYYKSSLNPLNSIVTSDKDTSGKISTNSNTVTLIFEKRYTKSEKTKEIEPEIVYLNSDKLLKGETLTQLKGHPGKELIITTHDNKTGKDTNQEKRTIVKATSEIVLKGTADPIKIPMETSYIHDDKLLENEEVIEKNGSDGTRHPNGKTITEMVRRIIRKGTGKPKEIDFDTIYKDSEDILEGDPDVVIEEGEKGLLHPNGKDIIKPAKRRVIKRGIGKPITIPKGEPEIEFDNSLDEGYEELITRGADGLKKPNGDIIKNPIKDKIKKGTKKILKGSPEIINKQVKNVILYVDESTNEILVDSTNSEFELPKKPPVFLNNREYTYTKKEEIKDGIIKYYYRKNKPVVSYKPKENLTLEKPELELPKEALKTEIQPEKEQKNIVVYMDLDGNNLMDNTTENLPDTPPKFIKNDEYEYTGKSEIEDGITKYIYSKLKKPLSEKIDPEINIKESKRVVLLVDEDDNIIDSIYNENDFKIPKYLENNKYIYTGLFKEEDNILKYTYKKLEEEVKNLTIDKPELELPEEALKPETQPEKEQKNIIVYIDLNGNVLDDNNDKELPENAPEFIQNEKYIYTGKSETEDGITKHIYDEVKSEKGKPEIIDKPEFNLNESEIKPEIQPEKEPKNITVYTDLNGNVLDDNSNKELPENAPKFIQNEKYIYTGKSETVDGVTKHIYDEVKSEKGKPETTDKPELELPEEALKPEIQPKKEQKNIVVYVDLNGNILEESNNKEVPNFIMNGKYIYTGRTETVDGITKYIYDEVKSEKGEPEILDKPELELPEEALKPEIQAKKEQKNIIVYTDLNGNVLSDNIKNKEISDNIPNKILNDTYIYTGLTSEEDGIKKYIFDKIVFEKPSETLINDFPKLEIPEEVLKPEIQPKKEEKNITVYTDLNGNVLDDNSNKELPDEAPNFIENGKYVYTGKVEIEDGITKYIYDKVIFEKGESETIDKLELELPEEALKPETQPEKEQKNIIVYVDLNGNVLDDNSNKELPENAPKFIQNENYIYTGKVEIEDGITKYIYDKVISEKGESEIMEKLEFELPEEALKAETQPKKEELKISIFKMKDGTVIDTINSELLVNNKIETLKNEGYELIKEPELINGITTYYVDLKKEKNNEDKESSNNVSELTSIRDKEENNIKDKKDLNEELKDSPKEENHKPEREDKNSNNFNSNPESETNNLNNKENKQEENQNTIDNVNSHITKNNAKKSSYLKSENDVFSPIAPENKIEESNNFESETDKMINYLEKSINKDLHKNENSHKDKESHKNEDSAKEEKKQNEQRAAAVVAAVSTAVGTVGGGAYLASNPDKFRHIKNLLKKIIK